MMGSNCYEIIDKTGDLQLSKHYSYELCKYLNVINHRAEIRVEEVPMGQVKKKLEIFGA